MADLWFNKTGVKDLWLAMTSGKDQDAKQFAEASLVLISVFDLIPGMSVASGDMIKNATTIKTMAGESGKTLKELVDAECGGKDAKALKAVSGDGKTFTCALLWLVRALYFIVKLLEPLVNDPSKKTSECVLAGYEVSLKPHHGFMVKGTFSVAVKAAPNRENFLAKLDVSEAEVKAKVDAVAPVAQALLDALNEMLKGYSADHLKVF